MAKHSLDTLSAIVLATFFSVIARAADDSHKAPIAPDAPSVHEQRQATLAELWQRGLLAPDAGSFTPQDEELLARVHQAEAMAAVRYLRARGPIGGLVIEMKGKTGKVARLTKTGYEKWRLMRSQDALKFFQAKDIGAVDAFKLKDLEGRPLFDKEGLLTEQGLTVMNLAGANLEAHWVKPSGQVLGNRPPPKPKSP